MTPVRAVTLLPPPPPALCEAALLMGGLSDANFYSELDQFYVRLLSWLLQCELFQWDELAVV